jgi:hypothetical protein
MCIRYILGGCDRRCGWWMKGEGGIVYRGLGTLHVGMVDADLLDGGSPWGCHGGR